MDGTVRMYKTDEEKKALHTQLVKWLGNCENSTSETEWKRESSEDYKFYAGDQDTTEVKAILAKQKRPCTVYNEIAPKINMLVGMGADLDGAISLSPRSPEDAPLTELMTQTIDYFREILRQNRKENNCFEHAIKGGKSWLHFYVDEEDEKSPLKTQRVPARDIHVDPDSIEFDKSDARYLFRDKWLDLDDIETAWPEFKFARDTAGNVISGNFDAVSGTSVYTPTFFNEANDKYRVVECWWRKYETKYVFLNPLTGNKEELFEDEYNEFVGMLRKGFQLPNGEVLQQDNIQSTPKVIRTIWYAIISGKDIIELGRSIYKHGMFPYAYMEAYHDEENNCPFSVIKNMKDPQRGLNTTRRQLIHLLQTLPKGILVHEVGAILNIEDYEENSSKPGFHLEVEKGGLQRYKFEQQPQISQIYAQLDSLFQQSMKDTSGIQDALLGIQTSTREPGITAQMRSDANVSVLYTLFDNYKEFKYQCMRLLMGNIQQFVTEPFVIRIRGQQGVELLQINSQLNPQAEGWNNVAAGNFDIIADNNVITKSVKLTIAKLLAEYSHNNPGAVPPDLLMEYSDMPYTAQMKVRNHAAVQQQSQQQQIAFEQHVKDKELELEERKVVVLEKEVEIKRTEASKKPTGGKQNGRN